MLFFYEWIFPGHLYAAPYSDDRLHNSMQACTCTTDLRSFVHFGRGQATCYGPVAENIHGSNERVDIESVIHVAKVYALFLARWSGLAE